MPEAADVQRAFESNRDRWQELGADPTSGVDVVLAELGFDGEQLPRTHAVMMREGVQWVQHLPMAPTFEQVAALVAAAQMHALAAGIRLGRFHAGDAPGDPSDPRDDAPA